MWSRNIAQPMDGEPPLLYLFMSKKLPQKPKWVRKVLLPVAEPPAPAPVPAPVRRGQRGRGNRRGPPPKPPMASSSGAPNVQAPQPPQAVVINPQQAADSPDLLSSIGFVFDDIFADIRCFALYLASFPRVKAVLDFFDRIRQFWKCMSCASWCLYIFLASLWFWAFCLALPLLLTVARHILIAIVQFFFDLFWSLLSFERPWVSGIIAVLAVVILRPKRAAEKKPDPKHVTAMLNRVAGSMGVDPTTMLRSQVQNLAALRKVDPTLTVTNLVSISDAAERDFFKLLDHSEPLIKSRVKRLSRLARFYRRRRYWLLLPVFVGFCTLCWYWPVIWSMFSFLKEFYYQPATSFDELSRLHHERLMSVYTQILGSGRDGGLLLHKRGGVVHADFVPLLKHSYDVMEYQSQGVERMVELGNALPIRLCPSDQADC